MVVRYLIADDGTFGGIHDEPDVGPDTTDFDIGFISSKDIAGVVIIVVNKGLANKGTWSSHIYG